MEEKNVKPLQLHQLLLPVENREEVLQYREQLGDLDKARVALVKEELEVLAMLNLMVDWLLENPVRVQGLEVAKDAVVVKLGDQVVEVKVWEGLFQERVMM